MDEMSSFARAEPQFSDELAVRDVVPAPRSAPPWRRLVAVTAVLVVIVGLLASIVTRRNPDEPASELAGVVSFADGANTVHVDATVNVATFTDDGLGTTYNTRWRLEGAIRFPNEAHLLVHTGDRVFQRILVGDDLYERSAVAEENLYLNRWSQSTIDRSAIDADPAAAPEEPETSDQRSQAWDLVSQGAGFGSELQRMRRVLARTGEPTRVSTNVIRIELGLPAFLDAYFADLALDEETLAELEKLEGSVTLDITSGPKGRLDRIVAKVDARSRADGARPREGWQSTADVRFTEWGAPVEIAAPNMDPFPELPVIDLEGIARAQFTVLAPKTVAPDLKLLEASYFVPEDRGLDEPDCDKVTLYYAPEEEPASVEPGYSDLRFLNLDIASIGCESDDSRTNEAYLEKRAGAPSAYSVGPYRGTIARYDTPEAGRGVYIVLEVDGVEVFVDSTLSAEETTLALSELVAFDPRTQPIVGTPSNH
jgi:hypothetical protein